MTKKRQRWAEVARLPKLYNHTPEAFTENRHQWDVVANVVIALERVGKSVRVMKAQYGDTLVFKARRGGT